MILVDTNVLIDVREEDAVWATWSFGALADARLAGDVVTSVITIGELASSGGSFDELRDLSRRVGARVLPLSAAAAYRAGRAQHAYRAAGGRREKLLADFLIGGEAEAIGAAVLTRDPRHYRSYFPELELITPESHP